MKKFLKVLLCLSLLACSACSSGKEKSNEKEVLYYSADIRIVTKDLKSTSELTDKVLAVQSSFDKEYSDYVIEQLKNEGIELSEDNLHWFTNYSEIKFDIDDGSIDAWVIYDNREDTIVDYRNDYNPSDYTTLATYNIPYYEQEEADTSNYVDYLYNEPFMVMLNGLDGYGENSVHEWSQYRNDVNHLLVVNPEKKHILIVSIPRDSYITNIVTGYKDKFTHFCQNGPDNPANSLGSLLDADIPYYCMTSFTWFVYGVNELGGVKVDVPMDGHLDMDSTRDVANPQTYEKGVHNLYGETALALVRNRKYDGIVNNDQGRIRNQALILNGLISKIANHPYLLNMVGMSWLFDYLCENNFSSEEKTTLFALAQTFADGYTIDNYFLEGDGNLHDNGTYYVDLYDESIEIAKGKIELVTNGSVSKDNPYYDQIMTGYITGGAGTESDGDNGYIGTTYDLSTVFE